MHTPLHFQDYLMLVFQRLDDLPPSPIVVVNFGLPSDSSLSLKFVVHSVVLMTSTT
jgi:hypothetical protein